MGRISIQLKQEGPIIAIKMTSRFFGIPLFRVYAFFVNGLLIDTGFVHGRDRFLKLCVIHFALQSWSIPIIMRITLATTSG
ncbi:MAG: hypothetical protein ABSH06_28300 [Thermodesulfobacteriota bacterium]